jgi:glutamate synthase domain-containing protein 2
MDAPTREETPDQAAQYIASMTQELAELARRNGLETLSRILEMARLEAISAPSAQDKQR